MVQCPKEWMAFPGVHGDTVGIRSCIALGKKLAYSRNNKKGNIPYTLPFFLAG